MDSVAPLVGGSGTDLRMKLSGAGSKGRLASRTVCRAGARPGADALRALAIGAGPRPRTVACCASACSHSYQCVALIWRSDLPPHRRSRKARSQWYTPVWTASWSSRSAGSAAAGQTPGVAALALALRRARSRRAWWSPSRRALTITRAQSATQITALGPSRCLGLQTATCASAGQNMQTSHFGLCFPRCATARLAAGQACVMGPGWESGTCVVRMASPCHAARRCSSWLGLQTRVGGSAHPGSCRLLGVLMVCSTTASGQGAAPI